MKGLKGLKGPQLKMPPFAVDLFYDLRDRRLLPLVAVIIVAIAAAPILLGGSKKKKAPAPIAAAAVASALQSGTQTASLTVVQSKPGLRDYRKRLAGRRATDPFKQRYTGPVLKGAKLNSQTTTSSTATGTTTSTSTTFASQGSSSPAASSPSSTLPSSGGGNQPHIALFTFVIDVKISKAGGGNGGAEAANAPVTKQHVRPMTPLPGEKTPVVTYMGVGGKAKTALLMVSNNVNSILGDGKCLSGTDTCQLVEVEPGFPETFLYGSNNVRYKINVLKIEPILDGHS